MEWGGGGVRGGGRPLRIVAGVSFLSLSELRSCVKVEVDVLGSRP